MKECYYLQINFLNETHSFSFLGSSITSRPHELESWESRIEWRNERYENTMEGVFVLSRDLHHIPPLQHLNRIILHAMWMMKGGIGWWKVELYFMPCTSDFPKEGKCILKNTNPTSPTSTSYKTDTFTITSDT